MTFGLNKRLLDLLGNSHSNAEPSIIFHVFLKDEEIGRLAISGHSSIYTGNITAITCKKLTEYLKKESNTPSHKRASDFELNQEELTYHVIVERLEPPTALYILGAGHVGQAVAAIGALVGYSVVVIDDRKEFLTRERFPNLSVGFLEESYDQIGNKIKIPGNSAVVIVTRGHQYDEICLKQVLTMNAQYVGMIGSRRRVISIFHRLINEGISKDLLDKVHAPIGLKIAAVSPQEIAIAIMAEIIDVMNGTAPSQNYERRLSQ